MRGTVISESGFVGPLALGTHKVWTYTQPGVDGKGNPSGRVAAFESAGEITELLSSAEPTTDFLPGAGDQESPIAIVRLKGIAGYRRPSLRRALAAYEDQLGRADLPLSAAGLRAVVGIAAMSSLTWQVGATWRVARRG